MFDEIQVPNDFSVLTEDALTALDGQARTAAGPLVEKVNKSETLDSGERAALQRLSDVVTGVQGDRARRIGEASVARADAQKITDAAAVFATAPPAPAPEAAPAAPADPPKTEETVTASVAAPGIAEVAANAPTPVVPAAVIDLPRPRARLVAAPNLPNVNAGTEFASVMEIGQAAEAQMATYRGAPQGAYLKTPVAYLQRNYPPELRIDAGSSQEDILRVFDHVADESRLPGGSLVAAAGWCAPSEIDYALFELETMAGLLDLPTAQINRGGLQFTTGPDFSAIFGGTGYWHQTEAQVQAATAKPCMVIPCPTFTEKRLEVEGTCITGAFLQDRGYPEMVARFVRGAMTAHAHKLNIFVINQIIAGSTLFDYQNVANLPITTSEYKDLSVLSRLLAVAGIQIMDYRYKYRMDPEASLEVILPYWVIESVRADVQRRTGLSTDDSFNVAVSEINAWFAIRGARVQYMYDWLDAYNTTNTSTVGQTAGVYTLPTTVEMVIFAAGTWVKGVADVVRLDTVYDSTNLALNQYVQLFSEEGILVAKRGFESRRVRITISPSGVTGATADMRTG